MLSLKFENMMPSSLDLLIPGIMDHGDDARLLTPALLASAQHEGGIVSI